MITEQEIKLSKQIDYMQKQIGVWAKELTKILEGHFEIASSQKPARKVSRK